ncbi:MAG TPA: type II toxin-antitoxin system VapC family toxin [Planctomycetaceae bacterium]
MGYLIDTDVCSAYLKNDRRAFQRFIQHGGRLHLSAVTVGELMTWASRASAPPARLRDFVDLMGTVTVLDYTDAVARRFGELRAWLFDNGRPVPDVDLMIASTALHHSLTLVTHNVRHYANIPALTVEDWLAP